MSTATAVKTVITPDTTVYTLTQDAVGYTLEDSILGNQTPAEYAANCNDLEQDIQSLCDWLQDLITPGGGFFLSAKDAQDFLDEENERGYDNSEVESFTPRSIHEYILELARKEA